MQTIRNRILLIKEEATYGVNSAPTVAANAIEASNIKISYQGDLLVRDNVRSNISPVSPILGRRWVEITFNVELKGGGTRGTAGKLGDLLEACSMAETASVGSSVTYVPTSTSQKSVTVYAYDNDVGSAVLTQITGAVGTFSLKITAGQYAVLSFTFRGIYNAPTDVALPSAPTYETTAPPVVESCAFTLNALTTLIAQELNLDLANEITDRDDISSANAIKAFNISNRNPKGSFNPEAILVASYNFWADWVAATQRALSIVIGATQGNIITITAPKVTIDTIGEGERERVLTREIPFTLGQNVGNDELSIKFT